MTSEDFIRLRACARKDIEFDELDIANQCFKIPRLYQKYLDVYITELDDYKELVTKRDYMHGKKLRDIRLNGDIAWKNNSEMVSQINSDEEYHRLMVNIDKQEVVIKFIEKTLTNIKELSYNIKNYIEVRKFLSGRD